MIYLIWAVVIVGAFVAIIWLTKGKNSLWR